MSVSLPAAPQGQREKAVKSVILETKACIEDLTYERGRAVSDTFANGGGGGIATYVYVVGINVVGRRVIFHWLQDHSRMIVCNVTHVSMFSPARPPSLSMADSTKQLTTIQSFTNPCPLPPEWSWPGLM